MSHSPRWLQPWAAKHTQMQALRRENVNLHLCTALQSTSSEFLPVTTVRSARCSHRLSCRLVLPPLSYQRPPTAPLSQLRARDLKPGRQHWNEPPERTAAPSLALRGDVTGHAGGGATAQPERKGRAVASRWRRRARRVGDAAQPEREDRALSRKRGPERLRRVPFLRDGGANLAQEWLGGCVRATWLSARRLRSAGLVAFLNADPCLRSTVLLALPC